MQLKTFVIAVILIFSLPRSWSQTGADVAIYADTGTWKDGITALRQFLKWKGLTYKLIYANQINTDLDLNQFKIIVFPGGYAGQYNRLLNPQAFEKIRKFTATGHAYFGICAGAYFASDMVIWQDTVYSYKLRLFHGLAIGPIVDLAPWPLYKTAKLQMNLQDSLNRYENLFEYMLYYGGPFFSPTKDFAFDTVATYAINGKPAIIRFNYGNGRVLLIGTHPEIEEDSDRDSTSMAQELNDYGSDWKFLWSVFDYLLNQPISRPGLAIPHANFTFVYPNPTRGQIWVSPQIHDIRQIKIFSLDGRTVKIFRPDANSFNVKPLKPGAYIIELETRDKIFRQKLIVL